MSYRLPARNQHYHTAEQILFFGKLDVISAGPNAVLFNRLVFSEPFGKSLARPTSTVADQSFRSRSRIDLPDKIRRAVTDALSDGVPTLSAIAAEVGVGPRTLQRRLSAQGYSFQRIVDLARQTLAHRLLRETELCLAEIAFLTGFSEQSCFTRAFKRWAGQTPRSYRLEARSVRQSRLDATAPCFGDWAQPHTAQSSNQPT